MAYTSHSIKQKTDALLSVLASDFLAILQEMEESAIFGKAR